MPIIEYVLRRDMVCEQYGSAFLLPKGSRCRYFDHTDVYLFEAQDNYVPYFLRATVERFPQFFCAIVDWNPPLRSALSCGKSPLVQEE